MIKCSVEVTTELGRIFVFEIVFESTKGFDRLERFSLNGWIACWSIAEMLTPCGMTWGDIGSSFLITERKNTSSFLPLSSASSILPKLATSRIIEFFLDWLYSLAAMSITAKLWAFVTIDESRSSLMVWLDSCGLKLELLFYGHVISFYVLLLFHVRWWFYLVRLGLSYSRY